MNSIPDKLNTYHTYTYATPTRLTKGTRPFLNILRTTLRSLTPVLVTCHTAVQTSMKRTVLVVQKKIKALQIVWNINM
jgi:hypothetical protein